VNRFSLTHLSNEVLRSELTTKAVREKEATAELLAHIAEFDERKLYLPAAYESMLAYCIGELGLSKDEAKKRIHVARAGRTCPGVFEALEQGRVHLTGLRILAPHLTSENADELATRIQKGLQALVCRCTPALASLRSRLRAMLSSSRAAARPTNVSATRRTCSGTAWRRMTSPRSTTEQSSC